MFSRLATKLTSTFLALAGFALAAQPAAAQCAPDGLNGGPCCAPAAVNLPLFPQRPQENASFICFDSCQPMLNKLYCARLGAPKPVKIAGAIVCGQYDIRYQLLDCATGAVVWSGSMRATYSRNWLENAVAGAVPMTVWRFILNGDLLPGPALPNTPCDRPSCLNQYARVYWTGYIDYALDCATGQWSIAWMLDHECDAIHHPAGSIRPAPAVGLHPSRSFSIVGPGATFVPASAALIQSDGPITQGAMRFNNWAATPAICTFEEPIQGAFVAQNQFCMCTTAGPGQYISSFVQAQGNCGSSVNPSPLGPVLQKRIGGWTNPNVFPGNEFVFLDFGYLATTGACAGTVSQEWYEGVETIGGFPANDFAGVALGRQFEDFGSCNSSPTSAATRIGAPHVSYFVLNMNLP